MLQINWQWYYQHCRSSVHQQDDQRGSLAIQAVREAEAFYGYRRVTKALVRARRIGQSQTGLRVMRQAGLTRQAKATHGAHKRFETEPI